MGLWELPQGWETTRLGDLVETKTGFACAKKNLVSQGVPHLRPFNVGTNGELDLSEVYQIPEDYRANIEDYALEPGHILFNNTNSVELVGKTAVVREPLRTAFSNHITRLTVNDISRVVPAWVALALRQLWATGYFSANCNRWIGQAGFNTRMLSEVEILLPDPEEQRRIVARVEALFAELAEARRLHEALCDEADRVLDSASAEIFSQAETRGWEYRPFSEAWSEKARYGSFKKPQVEETDYPVIRVGNVVDSSLVLDDLKFLSVSERELERCGLVDGDVVVARAIGSRAHLGKCAVFRAPSTGKTFVLDSHLIRVRLDQGRVEPDYIRHYLSSSVGRDEILKNSRQSAIQFNINVRELASVGVPLPPLSQQRHIVEYLDGVQAQVTTLKRAQEVVEAELKRLEQAVLARAFRGEL